MKYLRVILVSCFLLPAFAIAHPAENLIRDVATNVMASLSSDRAKNDEIFARQSIADDLLPHVDVRLMLMQIVGKDFWLSADKKQRGLLKKEFQTNLINTYTETLIAFSDGSIDVLPYEGVLDSVRSIVIKTVMTDGAAKFAVDFKMFSGKRTPDTWKVVDIYIDKVSRVAGHRSQYSKYLDESGIDGLIKALKELNSRNK